MRGEPLARSGTGAGEAADAEADAWGQTLALRDLTLICNIYEGTMW